MPISDSLTDTIKILRAKAEETRAMGRVSYPAPLREEISTCVATLRSQGVTWEHCKEALGVCKATLYAWHRESKAMTPGTAMVPVKIRLEKKSVASQTLRIVTPNGHELSGLDLAEAAQVLRVLG